jgi:quercetin dioxygenase-like cupin family protein
MLPLLSAIRRVACLALVVVACGGRVDRRAPKDASASSAFAAVSGVTRPNAGERKPFNVVRLHSMTEDVEILYGDPEKPGEPFAMRIRELAGTVIPLHSHDVDEHITVVQGTWYFAVGDTWDRSKLTPLHAGDYAFAAKGSTMFGYCPDGAIVQVQGVGPFLIHWKHGVKTLDDSGATAVFTFRKGEKVQSARGAGVIRQGYSSGDIIQYEIAGDSGTAFMVDQSALRRR